LIEGLAALIVINIQASTFIDGSAVRLIDNMAGYKDRMLKARSAIDAARVADIPVVFIQEAHHFSLVDFGRELGGDEDIHYPEDNPKIAIAVEEIEFLPHDCLIQKRRYSAFFSTNFEILVKGLGVNTLIIVGGLTDVCVHYTFVDGHQSDYCCWVIDGCVGGSSLAAHDVSLAAMEYLQTSAIRILDEVLLAMAKA
jgi:nicotinamidase-related amidase